MSGPGRSRTATEAADHVLQRLREWVVGNVNVFGCPGDGVNGLLAACGRVPPVLPHATCPPHATRERMDRHGRLDPEEVTCPGAGH
ncbi:hypothetical protein [Streptomyces sp. NBC_00847]|uniref:hypothetical protein n=1 Tax=Streptomyces sp. NBC_00847 TaxID=2975850 RepID=UPI00225DD9CB|nr:hypothetical protein [Streptomyces sp. NBC_00847]MCX4885004.1 hypothetical protein [Streptomyces sp. NBC_00847]